MIRLYQREGCSSCARVRGTLTDLGIDYEIVNVPKLGSERKQVLELAGIEKPEVPVLVDGDRVIQDSQAILSHLKETYGGGFEDPSYGLTRKIEGKAFDDVVAATREALSTEGFGVLTEIDVKKTLKAKLDVEMRDYLILGACNPPLAHKAITAEPGIGLLLPCNVVVAADGDAVAVSAVDPVKMFSVVNNPHLEPVAKDVGQKLRRVLAKI